MLSFDLYFNLGRAISRVLYLAIIYLDLPLLTSSSDLPPGRQRATALSPSLVLLRMGFTRPVRLRTAGELLPHHFNLTTALPVSAECFCCTFPIVTYAGRYPASCPVEPGLSSSSLKGEDAIVCSTQICRHIMPALSVKTSIPQKIQNM